MPTSLEPSAADDSDEARVARRAFLTRAGGAALSAPIAASLIASAGVKPAFATSRYGGGGGHDGHGGKKGPKKKKGGHKKPHHGKK